MTLGHGTWFSKSLMKWIKMINGQPEIYQQQSKEEAQSHRYGGRVDTSEKWKPEKEKRSQELKSSYPTEVVLMKKKKKDEWEKFIKFRSITKYHQIRNN